jgi:tellurite resistance protein
VTAGGGAGRRTQAELITFLKEDRHAAESLIKIAKAE